MGAETIIHHPTIIHWPSNHDILCRCWNLRYPIFHDQLSHRLGDQSDWTLASVFFDLQEAAASG
jgi:hypothetical protein